MPRSALTLGADKLVAEAAAGLELSIVCQKAKATPTESDETDRRRHTATNRARGEELRRACWEAWSREAHPFSTVIVTGIAKVAPWQPFDDEESIDTAPGRWTW